MSKFNNLKISQVIRETSKAVSLLFEVPENLKELYKFLPGQYLTVKANINNEEIRRDYSISSTPNSNKLKVTVKEIENGTFSKYANNNISINDEFEVSTPNGKFTYSPSKENSKTKIAFAAGSGITPVFSIIKSSLEQETESKVVLFYGNKSEEDTIFFNEIREIEEKYKDRFEANFLFSKEEKEYAVKGRISNEYINKVIKKFDVNNSEFFICGPEELLMTIKSSLIDNSFSEENIHYELFKASVNEEHIDSAAFDGNTEITVIVDDETFSCTAEPNDTILDAALDADIDAPYSCQGGICSSCIGRIKEGTAEMKKNSLLNDSEIAEGLIITCVAHATSSKLVIDFDDV